MELKKGKIKLHIIAIIILILVMILIISTTRKIFIILDLTKKAEATSKISNYHSIQYAYDNSSYSKIEVFSTENKQKIIFTWFRNDEISKVELYAIKNEENGKYLVNTYSTGTNKKPTATIGNEQDSFIPGKIFNDFTTLKKSDLIKSSIFSKIKSFNFNDIDCYQISHFNRYNDVSSSVMYVDKATGLILHEPAYQYKNEKPYPATNREYEFDIVTNEDLIEPDISNYEIQ